MDQCFHRSQWRTALRPLVLLLSCTLFCAAPVAAQQTDYESTLITAEVENFGSIELMALTRNTDVYISLQELFGFLKLKCEYSKKRDSLYGFILQPAASYLFTRAGKRFHYSNKQVILSSKEAVWFEETLFVNPELLSVLGIQAALDFRSLSMQITTSFDIPAVKERKLENLRMNISKTAEEQADTTLPTKRPFFYPALLDWSTYVIRSSKGAVNSNQVLTAAGILAGGDFEYNLNAANLLPYAHYFRWRKVNNNSTWLKQLTLGRTFTSSIATLPTPLNGIQLTNAPTSFRRSFGTYRISNRTEPGWLVELYLNNVLVDYVKADASGLYHFDVPMVYGNSNVTLRFYGPWGEERVQEQPISIPFNFTPPGEAEYSLTAGILQNGRMDRFSRFQLNYGLNNRVTLGLGSEYLSSLQQHGHMPFVLASVRVASSAFLTAEYIEGVRSKALFTWSGPGSLQLDLSHSLYNHQQKAIPFSYLQESHLSLSMPVARRYNGFYRLSLNYATMPGTELTSAELLLSSSFAGISANLATSASYSDGNKPWFISTLSVNSYFGSGLRARAQAQYLYAQHQFGSFRLEAEQKLWQDHYAGFNFGYDPVNRLSSWGVHLNLQLSSLQASLSSNQSASFSYMQASASGSIRYNAPGKRLEAVREAGAGQGMVILVPFLDLNGNGHRDAGEAKVTGLNVWVGGGGMVKTGKDTTLAISNLEGYTDYILYIDAGAVENVSWQCAYQSVKLNVTPNAVQRIDWPLVVTGEISGTALLHSGTTTQPVARLWVRIYNAAGRMVAEKLTGADGSFEHMGLHPGIYTVRLDEKQLEKLHLKADKKEVSFTIHTIAEGDLVTDLDFHLRKEGH